MKDAKIHRALRASIQLEIAKFLSQRGISNTKLVQYLAKSIYSYLKKLEAQSRHRRVPDEIAQSANSSAPVSGRLTSAARPSSHGQSAESDISNPLSGSGRLLQQQSVGESTCAVFADRLLQTLQPEEILAPANPEQSYVRRAEFARGVSDPGAFQLPERIRANLLIRVALRFIGQDYHFFLHKEFFSQLEQAYASKTSQGTSDPSWTCKFFVVLALGELYCGTASIGDTSGTVPGTNHFVNAVLLLQDLYEEPSLTQVEIMLLFVSSPLPTFSSNLSPWPSTQMVHSTHN